MSYIDILIPLVGGIVVLQFPSALIPKNATEDQKAKRKHTLVIVGWGLIGLSLIYLIIKILGPK
ncbi:MAG: hypothetical protein KAJ14_12520 [Candidatus Omnitrophica bacterium]|nr:hypothetical protein [Candidatus Omnitrophota bacterium]MCK5493927.1 hypothetical protein [Candidatus Omnitrophota bacterium]